MKLSREDTCGCLQLLQKHCHGLSASSDAFKKSVDSMQDNEFGKIAYTISILLMFSFVIVLLMVRSIRRTNATIENPSQVEALLDAMRFREELDIQERQKRRLMKAKNKVTAWLTKTHSASDSPKQWRSSPQLIQPRKYTSSTVSEIPEIVVTDDGPWIPRRPTTPCLSLIYDFSNNHRNSMSTDNDSRHRGSLSSQTSLTTTRQSMSLDRECVPRLSIQSHSMSFD
ncbi:unnamed protein product [Auanema sp. JU1783]|nr:unnamed protein product [Auanema sp. JU1783]